MQTTFERAEYQFGITLSVDSITDQRFVWTVSGFKLSENTFMPAEVKLEVREETGNADNSGQPLADQAGFIALLPNEAQFFPLKEIGVQIEQSVLLDKMVPYWDNGPAGLQAASLTINDSNGIVEIYNF